MLMIDGVCIVYVRVCVYSVAEGLVGRIIKLIMTDFVSLSIGPRL